MYFNKKKKRTGKLWQGVFKSKHIDSDNYLKYTFSYIHLNPAKYIDKNWKENSKKDAKKIFDFVFNYKYSSLQIYSKVAKGYDLRVLNMVSFPSYFKNPEEHKKELLEWLHYNP
jgi:putative transposase